MWSTCVYVYTDSHSLKRMPCVCQRPNETNQIATTKNFQKGTKNVVTNEVERERKRENDTYRAFSSSLYEVVPKNVFTHARCRALIQFDAKRNTTYDLEVFQDIDSFPQCTCKNPGDLTRLRLMCVCKSRHDLRVSYCV